MLLADDGDRGWRSVGAKVVAFLDPLQHEQIRRSLTVRRYAMRLCSIMPSIRICLRSGISMPTTGITMSSSEGAG